MLTWVEINTDAIRANIDAFRMAATPRMAVMAVVKANAYGHGLETTGPAAADRADWLGVNTVEEAMALYRMGIRKPVAILGHTELDLIQDVVRHNFRQVVYRLDVAAALSRAAKALSSTAQIHLKIETGTNRQGIALRELPEFIEQLRKLPGLNIEGAYTHFANIEDTLDPSYAKTQFQRFRKALGMLDKEGIHPPQIHAAATAGTLLYPDTGFTMIRVGIGTYGVWPSRETQIAARERGRQISLTPALTWKTRVAQLKTVAKGDYVGYGLTYQATRRSKLAVIPVGYFDGYDRRLSNCGRTLVGGHPAPVVGRVMMNMTMIDVTDTDAGVDDEVVLLGRQGESQVSVEEVAEKAGTISYEVLSRINPMIPRIAVGAR